MANGEPGCLPTIVLLFKYKKSLDIEFDLNYSGDDAVLTCIGTLTDINHMSGDWTWRANTTIYDQDTWSLIRD